MHTTRAWIAYTVIRLLAFAVPCAAILLALPGWEFAWLLAVAVGAIVSGLVSFIFLRRQRSAMAAGLAGARVPRDERDADAIAEDEALDQAARTSLEGHPEEGQDEGELDEELESEAAARDEDAEPASEPVAATSSLERPPLDDDTELYADAEDREPHAGEEPGLGGAAASDPGEPIEHSHIDDQQAGGPTR